jgi:hypothetical protein
MYNAVGAPMQYPATKLFSEAQAFIFWIELLTFSLVIWLRLVVVLLE